MIRSNMTEEKLQQVRDFYNTIDFKPVKDFICKLIGIDVNIHISPDIHMRYQYVKLESDDIIDKAGNIMQLMCRSAVVDNFGGFIGYNEEQKSNICWIPIHISYKSHSGGSNGMSIACARYKDGNWEFDIDSGRYKS